MENKTDEAITSIQQTGEQVRNGAVNTYNQTRDSLSATGDQVRDSVTGAYNQTRDSLSATGDQVHDSVTGTYNQTRDSLAATGEQINRGVENAVDQTRDSLQALSPAPNQSPNAPLTVPNTAQPASGPATSGRTGTLTLVPPQGGNGLNLAPAQTPSGTSLSLPNPTMNHSALGNYAVPGESITAAPAAAPTAATPTVGNTFPASPSATSVPAAAFGTQSTLQGTPSAQGGQSAPFGVSPSATSPTGTAGTIATGALTGGYRNYTTKERDNLLTIAENELGDSTRWGEIRRLNVDKDLTGSIPVGTVIKLPTSGAP